MMLFESYGSARRGLYGFLFGLGYGAFNMICRRISIAIWLDRDHQEILDEGDPMDEQFTDEVKLSKESQQELDIIHPPGFSDYEEDGTEMMSTEEYNEHYRKCKRLAAELRRQYEEEMRQKGMKENEIVCVMDPNGNETAKS